jgi:hypothetical protein
VRNVEAVEAEAEAAAAEEEEEEEEVMVAVQAAEEAGRRTCLVPGFFSILGV